IIRTRAKCTVHQGRTRLRLSFRREWQRLTDVAQKAQRSTSRLQTYLWSTPTPPRDRRNGRNKEDGRGVGEWARRAQREPTHCARCTVHCALVRKGYLRRLQLHLTHVFHPSVLVRSLTE